MRPPSRDTVIHRFNSTEARYTIEHVAENNVAFLGVNLHLGGFIKTFAGIVNTYFKHMNKKSIEIDRY